jgi:uncharacterized membrane protein
MLELGQTLGFFSAVLLIVACAAWVNLSRGSRLQPIDGPPEANRAPTEFASRLLALAFGLSAVAAVLAVVGWIGL